jgi:imidazolonepropionase-like amidohydrolase
VLPGFGQVRELELLVKAGFTPLEAIRIGTLEGARFLGQDREIGSIAPGKRANLMIVRGHPAARIGDLENVEAVFRAGVAYDSRALRDSVRGVVGLR